MVKKKEEIPDFVELTFWCMETQHIHKSMRWFKIRKGGMKIMKKGSEMVEGATLYRMVREVDRGSDSALGI